VKKIIAIALCTTFATLSLPTLAGVAPTTGASQYERSGAKIKPAPAPEEVKKANQEETKEPAK
jgi:hypothetical protein